MRKTSSGLPRVLECAALCAVFSAVLAPYAPAEAGSVQMLPPTGMDYKTACSNNPANPTYGMLQWDGVSSNTHPLTCIPGFTANVANGSVSIGGLLTSNRGLYVQSPPGHACSPTVFGSNCGVTVNYLAHLCPNGGNITANANGTLSCCPLGQALLANGTCGVPCTPPPPPPPPPPLPPPPPSGDSGSGGDSGGGGGGGGDGGGGGGGDGGGGGGGDGGGSG